MGQTVLTPSLANAPPENVDLSARVVAALRQAIPPETVREQFGLSREQFQAIIQEMNQATLELIRQWKADDSGYEEENADAIERALAVSPLSLREIGRK